MTQEERADFLINWLINERKGEYWNIDVPDSMAEKRRLLRGLVNVRPPEPISDEFLAVQDEYLKERLAERGVTYMEDLTPVQPDIYLWQGDITTLAADAIVNAANSRMLGCFAPCHACIDNAIHTFAGFQLRLECAALMKAQGADEPTGRAKITGAYNLPSRHVLHTVGPIISGAVSAVAKEDKALLESCYRSCLELAAEHSLESVAFCCISTGEFRFPNEEAAQIAVRTVKAFLQENQGKAPKNVIFNVFKDIDYEIYRRLLG